MKPSELIERTKSDINKIFEKEKGEYICDFGVTNCAYSDKAFDSVMCEVSDLQDELDKRFIDREELREKINAKIMLLGMCSDVYVEEEAKNKVIKIKQLKEILKLLEE